MPAPTPSWRERLRRGELNRVHTADGEVAIATPVVFHDPEAGIYAVVAADGDRHRELELRAAAFAELARDPAVAVPRYVRDLAVVFGPAELAALLDERIAGPARRREAAAQLERDAAALTERRAALAEREASLDRRARELEARQADLEAAGAEAARRLVEADRDATRLRAEAERDAARIRLDAEREAARIRDERRAPAPTPAPEPVTTPVAALAEPRPEEATSPFELLSEADAPALPTSADPVTTVTADAPRPGADGWLAGFVRGSAPAAFTLDGDRARVALRASGASGAALATSPLDVRLLVHRLPEYGVLVLLLGTPAALRGVGPAHRAMVPLDVAADLDRRFLAQLEREFVLEVDVVGRRTSGAPVPASRPRCPRTSATSVRAASDHVRPLGASASFARGLVALSSAPALDLLGLAQPPSTRRVPRRQARAAPPPPTRPAARWRSPGGSRSRPARTTSCAVRGFPAAALARAAPRGPGPRGRARAVDGPRAGPGRGVRGPRAIAQRSARQARGRASPNAPRAAPTPTTSTPTRSMTTARRSPDEASRSGVVAAAVGSEPRAAGVGHHQPPSPRSAASAEASLGQSPSCCASSTIASVGWPRPSSCASAARRAAVRRDHERGPPHEPRRRGPGAGRDGPARPGGRADLDRRPGQLEGVPPPRLRPRAGAPAHRGRHRGRGRRAARRADRDLARDRPRGRPRRAAGAHAARGAPRSAGRSRQRVSDRERIAWAMAHVGVRGGGTRSRPWPAGQSAVAPVARMALERHGAGGVRRRLGPQQPAREVTVNRMRIGIFSDVHANIEALSAVMEAFTNESIDQFYCLGDVVGYGAESQRVRGHRA
jgi:hypothetical protein